MNITEKIDRYLNEGRELTNESRGMPCPSCKTQLKPHEFKKIGRRHEDRFICPDCNKVYTLNWDDTLTLINKKD